MAKNRSSIAPSTGAESLLKPVAAGNGGINEMRESVDDSTVQFGLVRFELGVGPLRRQKMLFLHVNGANCSAVARGRANEYVADAKSIMDGGADEGFHASMEVKEKSEVTPENILERVCKFFITDDGADYSVKWLMETYEKFVEQAEASEGLNEDGTAKGSGLSCPGHKSASLFQSGRDALKGVADLSGPWNWVFVKADPDTLELIAGGAGSVDEMRECMEQNSKEVMFGLLRMGFGIGRLRRTKHVFVQAIGSAVSAFTRGKLGSTRSKMEAAFKPIAQTTVTLEIDDLAEFTLQEVIDKVRQVSVIDDEELDPDDISKNIFSVDHFREALAEEMRVLAAQAVIEPPVKKKPGYEDRDSGELVRLVRNPDGPVNWVLFSVNKTFKKGKATIGAKPFAQSAKQLRPAGPSAPIMPQGGYMRASFRSRSQPPETKEAPAPEIKEAPPPEIKEEPPPVAIDTSSQLRLSVASVASASAAEVAPCQFNMSTAGAVIEKRASVASVISSVSNAEPAENRVAVVPGQLRNPAPCWGPQLSGMNMYLAPKPQAPTQALRVRLAGSLLKQSPAMLHRWQLRHFEVSLGSLAWWGTLSEKKDGKPPRHEIDLQGLSIVQKSCTCFQVQTASTGSRLYVLDASSQACTKDDAAYDSSRWIHALQQESLAYAVLARKGRPAQAGGAALSFVERRRGHSR